MEFFREYGNTITARDFVELYRTCRLINPQVSPTNYNSKDRERYYILNLLPIYAVHNMFTYPVTVESLDTGKHNNMPDFRITDYKSDYILETVMATSEGFIKDSKKLAKEGKTYNDYKVSNIDNKTIVKLSEEEGSGFTLGFENEKAYANVISNSILAKTKILPKYNIEKDLGKELLVYHNIPGSVTIDYAENWLFDDLKRKGYYQMEPKFDKIHIQKDNCILYDIFGENKELHVYTLYEYLDHLTKENPTVFNGLPEKLV